MSLTREQRLQSFFYELLRDHVPAATVEHILQQDEAMVWNSTEVVYSNPYLADYAADIASRLMGEDGMIPSRIKNRLAMKPIGGRPMRRDTIK